MTDGRTVKRGLTDAVTDALADSVRELEQGIVTKFVCIVESVGADGVRGLWYLTSEQLKNYELLGLLTSALQHEQAETIAAALNIGDDD